MIGEKMGRYTYQSDQKGVIVLRAETRKGAQEVWQITPQNKDAYTVHFDHLHQGVGKLKINGKARFKVSVKPLGDVNSSSPRSSDTATPSAAQSQTKASGDSGGSERKGGARLPYAQETDAQEMLITLTDSIDESRYQLITPVFADHEVVWQISRERAPIDQTRPWRVDAKRLRQYRGRKRSRPSSATKGAKREQPAAPKDLKMPKLDH